MKRKHTLVALALLALAPLAAPPGAGAAAQQAAVPKAGKATPPPPAPAPRIQFPAFLQRELPNGLRLVVIEQHETPSASIQLLLPAGRVYAPAGKAGLAGATASLLREGTAKRSSQQIAETIDSIGGALNTFASTESGIASVQVTSDQLDLGLELLADVILNPTFPAEEIERWRSQALGGLQIDLTDPSYLATVAFERALFADHPYGQPAEGTPESVQGFTREDLVAFHKRQYVPNQAILAIVGDVRPDDAFARAERHFGGWKKGEEARIPPVKPAARERPEIVVVDKPDAVQTEIRAGHVGIAYTDSDHFAAQVYDSVLGGSSSARLFDEVRRKRGLAYGASSSFMMMTQPGYFRLSTSTKTESTVEALGVMLDVVRGLEKGPVPAEELTARKTYITGAFPLEIETPEGIASQVLEAMKYGYGKEFLESYRERISAVTAEDVRKFADRRIEPDRVLVVLVGNAKAFAADLEKKYGKVRTIPLAELDLLQPTLSKAPAAAKPAG